MTTCTNAPVGDKDQRGVTRSSYTSCDIGAFEYTADDVALSVVTSNPSNGSSNNNLAQITITFSKNVLSNGSANAGDNTANYLLVEQGVNESFDTLSCKGGVQSDDTQITIESVVYDASTLTATIAVNGGVPLPNGVYRLLVCGTTSVHDLIGLKLNGGLSDEQIDFDVTLSILDSGDDLSNACQLNHTGATCEDGPIKVVAAAGTVTDDQSCYIVIEEKSSGNFELDGRIFDVKVICNGVEKTSFDPPLKVCIKPTAAQLQAAGFNFANMVMYHNRGGSWTGYTSPQAFGENGYLCLRTDKLSEFTIRVLEAPATGFVPGVVTALEAQPVEKVYFDLAGGTHLSSGASLGSASQGASHLTSDFYLSIPKLGLEMPIVGVPLVNGEWDVSWLGETAGYLEGSAFPTWAGNTAITAHVWNADNTPGPFIDLHTLQHGDEIVIHAWGQDHVYEVRATREVGSKDLSLMEHSDYDVLTLITCRGFNQASGEYDWRLAVRAVLVNVETE